MSLLHSVLSLGVSLETHLGCASRRGGGGGRDLVRPGRGNKPARRRGRPSAEAGARSPPPVRAWPRGSERVDRWTPSRWTTSRGARCGSSPVGGHRSAPFRPAACKPVRDFGDDLTGPLRRTKGTIGAEPRGRLQITPSTMLRQDSSGPEIAPCFT